MLTLDKVYPISNSRLTAFKRSPAHLIHYLTKPKEQTPAMAFGSAFHCYVLQPEKFDQLYAVAPEVDRRTKDGKIEWEVFNALHKDKTVISKADFDKIIDMSMALYSNSSVGDILKEIVTREDDRTWINEETNAPMRGIIDGIGQGFMIDLKTCQDADPVKFARDAYNMNYHRQAAIYLDSHPDGKFMDYYIIAIEKDAPYGCSVHQLSDELIDAGRKQYIDYVIEYQAWVDDGMKEAGYEYWQYSGIYNLQLPAYAKLI
jgi:hypothetical protein